MTSTPSVSFRLRATASLWGLFMGDALASPVHWFYDLRALRATFPKGIQKYEKPPMTLSGSILNLSSTGGPGRGPDTGEVIGNMILHDKRKYWARGQNYHYHCTLEAGENTLEARLTLRLMAVISQNGGKFDKASWLKEFETFLTTPKTHNDCYASSYIRHFFANRGMGVAAEEAADQDHHNTDAIDAMTTVVPVAIAAAAQQRQPFTEVNDCLACTRRSNVLPKYADAFAEMLVSLLNRADDTQPPAVALRKAIEQAAPKVGLNLTTTLPRYAKDDPMVACYIDSAFSALLIMAYKYAENPLDGLLASANAGGENVARESALGALFGAAYGEEAWKETWLYAGLKDQEKIAAAIDTLLTSAQVLGGFR